LCSTTAKKLHIKQDLAKNSFMGKFFRSTYWCKSYVLFELSRKSCIFYYPLQTILIKKFNYFPGRWYFLEDKISNQLKPFNISKTLFIRITTGPQNHLKQSDRGKSLDPTQQLSLNSGGTNLLKQNQNNSV
jgi:hypothetical protein